MAGFGSSATARRPSGLICRRRGPRFAISTRGRSTPANGSSCRSGLAEVLYFDDRFGAAAELLDSVLDSSTLLGADGHQRALDWWASALDRYAQRQLPEDRDTVYARIIHRMEDETRQDPSSTAASYWLVAATRGAGDLDRSWAAAAAAWVRAVLAPDRGAALRADLDRLVTQALIPDRASRLHHHDRRQAMATMMSEWEEFKSSWTRQ